MNLCTPFMLKSINDEFNIHSNVRLTVKGRCSWPPQRLFVLEGGCSWLRNLTLQQRSLLAHINVATHTPEVTNSKTRNASRVDSIQEGQTHHPPDILGLHWIQESRRWLGPNKVAGRTRWQLDRWRQCKIKRRWARRDGRSFKAHRSGGCDERLIRGTDRTAKSGVRKRSGKVAQNGRGRHSWR